MFDVERSITAGKVKLHHSLQVYEGTLTDKVTDILGSLLERNGALPRYSSLVLQSESSPTAGGEGNAPRNVILDESVLGPLSSRAEVLSYLHAPGTQDDIKAISHWLVIDPEHGAQLLASSMAYLLQHELQKSRMALLLSPSAGQQQQNGLSRALLAATTLTSRLSKLPRFLADLAADAELWRKLLEGVEGAQDEVVALSEASGLNSVAFRRNWDAYSGMRIQVCTHGVFVICRACVLA